MHGETQGNLWLIDRRNEKDSISSPFHSEQAVRFIKILEIEKQVAVILSARNFPTLKNSTASRTKTKLSRSRFIGYTYIVIFLLKLRTGDLET